MFRSYPLQKNLTLIWGYKKSLCGVPVCIFQSRKRPFKHDSTNAYLSCGLFRCYSRRLLFNFNALPRKYRREDVRRFAGIQVRYILLCRRLSLACDWSELRRRALSCWAGQFNDDGFQGRLWFEAAKKRAGRFRRVSSGELVVLCFNSTLNKKIVSVDNFVDILWCYFAKGGRNPHSKHSFNKQGS